MASYRVQEAEGFGTLLEEMLERAQLVKQTNTIEPPLNKSDLPELWDQLESIFPSSAWQEPKTDPLEASMRGAFPPSPLAALAESRKHIIEAAVRDAFNNILVRHTSVRVPEHISDVP
jgi:THO complex subunit 1